MEKINEHRKGGQQFVNYLTQGRIMLWILICAFSLFSHLSSQASRESKLGFSTKQ